MPSSGAFRRQRRPGWLYAPSYAEKPRDNPRGLFPSRKCGQSPFWTRDEFRLMALLETVPEVQSFGAHPELIMLPDGPDWLPFVPSMTVSGQGFRVTVELSPLGFPRSDRQKRIAGLARTHCESSGAPFVELPIAAVRSKPRATDALLLLRYLSSPLEGPEELRVRDLLQGGPARLDVLEQASGISRGRLLGMAARGTLELHGPRPIGFETKLGLRRTGGRG